ncbi:MAG: hypothetical protein NW226_15030 [Microscillaceae bacterium]|nr:hypothetical protein [Microscillaceae bacterium]
MRQYLWIIFLGCVFSPGYYVFGQFSIEKRNVVPIDRAEPAEHEVVSLKQKGLLLISVVQPWKYASEKEFMFTYLDTTFNLIRTNRYLLPFIFSKQKVSYFDEYQYLFFFTQDEMNKEVSVFRVNIFSGEEKIKTFKLPLKMEVEEFRAVSDQVYLLGTFGSKPVVVAYSYIDETPKVIPSFYEDDEKVVHVQPDIANKQIYFTLKNNLDKNCNLIVKPYSNLIGTLPRIDVKERGQRTPLESRLLPIDNRKKVLVGTYSLKCTKNPQGLFIADFDGSEMRDIRYKKFVELSNFFNYHNEKKAERIREKIERIESKGRDFMLNRKFLIHNNFFTAKDENILVIEGYYTSYQQTVNRNTIAGHPFYYNNNFNYYNYNYYRGQFASPMVSTILNQYNYAIICAFDQEGRLKWDNVLKIDRVEKNSLEEVVQVGSMGDSIVLAYQKEEEIYSKLIHRYQEVKAETMQEVDDIFKDYEVSDNDWFKLIHWYDDVYLMYGEQRLKTKVTVDDQGGKLVFHTSKMRYYPHNEEDKVQAKKEQ